MLGLPGLPAPPGCRIDFYPKLRKLKACNTRRNTVAKMRLLPALVLLTTAVPGLSYNKAVRANDPVLQEVDPQETATPKDSFATLMFISGKILFLRVFK